jgi:hypothetical protein
LSIYDCLAERDTVGGDFTDFGDGQTANVFDVKIDSEVTKADWYRTVATVGTHGHGSFKKACDATPE